MEKKKFKAVELNHLDEETIMKIRDWRNQDFVRKMMYTQNIITEEEHLRYIEKVKKDPNRHLFVFYLDDEPFGVTQYTYDEDKNYVMSGNYLTDESFQDLGYGVIQIYYTNVIKFDYLNYENSYDETLDNNTNTLMMWKKTGADISLTSPEEVLLEDGYHKVHILYSDKTKWSYAIPIYEKIIYRLVDKDIEVVL